MTYYILNLAKERNIILTKIQTQKITEAQPQLL